MSKLTQLFTSDLENIPQAAMEALEQAATKGLPAKTTMGSQWLNRFKSTITGAASGMLPAGSKAEDYFTFMRDQFGSVDAPKLGHSEMVANGMHFDTAMTQHEMGIKLDKARITDLTTKYKDQKKLIDGMGATLSEARSAATHAVPQMIDAVKNESLAIQASLDALKNHKLVDEATIKALIADGEHKGLIKTVTEKGVDYFELALPNGKDAVRLGKAGDKIAVGTVQQAQREFLDAGNQLMQKQKGFIEEVSKGVGLMEEELSKAKTQFDKLGKLIGKPEVYASAVAEKTAVTAAEGMSAEVDNLLKASDKAKNAGVVGEAEMAGKGFFARQLANIKANFNIAEVTKDGNGVINATERGMGGKAMVAAGAGAGAILVGYGLKDLGKAVGMVSPDVDETGKEIPADSGTLVKSVAELGAGAALAYFTLLKGGKAAGKVL